MAAAVDVDISCDAVAAVAREAVLTVALLGRCLIPLHCQVVMGQPQLPVSWLWVQFEWLTLKRQSWFLQCTRLKTVGQQAQFCAAAKVTYCWFWVFLVHCCGFLPGLWLSLWKCTWCHTAARAQCSDFAWCSVQSSSCQQSYTDLQHTQTKNNPIHDVWASFGFFKQERRQRSQSLFQSMAAVFDSLNKVALPLSMVQHRGRGK